MDEVLTAAQILAQFECEWVLVEDPQTDEALGTPEKPFRSRDLHRYAVSVMRRAETMGLLPDGEVIEVLDREAMKTGALEVC